MIDWARVSDLRSEVGSEGFDEVVMLFMEETDEAVRLLEAPVPSGKLEEMLHFLKGSALNLGFVHVAHLCHEGERAAAEGRSDEVDLAALVESYRATRTAFLDGLSRLSPG